MFWYKDHFPSLYSLSTITYNKFLPFFSRVSALYNAIIFPSITYFIYILSHKSDNGATILQLLLIIHTIYNYIILPRHNMGCFSNPKSNIFCATNFKFANDFNDIPRSITSSLWKIFRSGYYATSTTSSEIFRSGLSLQ